MKLALSAFTKFIMGIVLVGLMLFLPAGGFEYYNAYLFLSIPLILGSWWSLLCFAPYVGVIVVRIINEEKFLVSQLDGYIEYTKRVKYRIVPFVW